MMDRGGRLITVLIIILAIISGLWLYNYFYGPQQQITKLQTPPSYIQTEVGTKVLIVDMNANERPVLEDVFTGEDAILAVHQGDDPFNHENDNVYANDLLMAMFDQNKDGRIDIHDSIYKRLELKYFDKAKNGFFGYMPIAQAGIRAIYIDPKYYSKFGAKDLYPRPIGTAIMSDGTARLIRQVLIDETYLKPKQTPAAKTPAPAQPTVPTQ